MGIRGLVPLSLIAVLALSGCGAFDSPSPNASCGPRLVAEGVTYRPAQFTFIAVSADGVPQIIAGRSVPGAQYSSCDDGGGLTGGGPTDAWRAENMDEFLILTLTECARLEGTEGAAGCDPKASPYMIWEPDVDSSASPQP